MWRPRRPTNGAKAMPRRNSLISRLRQGRAWDNDEPTAAPTPSPTGAETPKSRSRRRRLVVTLAFALLFVAGAAFSAGAGNQVRTMLEGQAASSAAGEDATTTEAAAPASTDPAPSTDPSADDSAPNEAPSDSPEAPSSPSEPAPAAAAPATVWWNRALPDPTPPALRLKPLFARHLLSVSRRHHVDWALMLGVLRAEGHNGSAPADLGGLRSVAARLGHMGAGSGSPWAAMFSLSNSTSFADRALALAHYYRGVGLPSIVNGLLAEKDALGQKVLTDRRVSIYAGGRGDIQAGRVNVRVLAVIEYLADSFGQVTVSCLISGHRLYARPGVISAHIYGLAADISEVG